MGFDQVNIENKFKGNIQIGIEKSKVYDPNEIARTTLKETNIHNNYDGQLNSQMPKSTIYDPDDITRTTLKETNIHRLGGEM